MEKINYRIGDQFNYKSNKVVIAKIIGPDSVMVEEVEKNIFHTVFVEELAPFVPSVKTSKAEIRMLSDHQWKLANERYEIIKPLLSNPNNFSLLKEIATENNIHFSTLYRWLEKFKPSGTVSSLTNKTRNITSSRIADEIEQIITSTIDKQYAHKDRKSIKKVIRTISLLCYDQNLEPPHSNTIRNRIKQRDQAAIMEARYGKHAAAAKFQARPGEFPGADYPLAVVQLDHSELDIILVDKINRLPVGKPNLTVAIDVYSRMVLGFYLSFDPPGTVGTGQCIANAILPKEKMLKAFNIDERWPCWGIMNTLHMDNAKEFRGDSLEKSCLEYGINIQFRPVKTPHYGGHIERLMGTFESDIHDLPGTTFSNPKERASYDSNANAVFTISEFEEWLTYFITSIYHLRDHEGINSSPLQRYLDGFNIENGNTQAAIQPRFTDERRLRLDFLPFLERRINQQGVKIHHLQYYDDVLRKYINRTTRSGDLQKHLFRFDPRNISKIYFFDPELDDYFEIPYRDISQPEMSFWEYKKVVSNLKKNNIAISEREIFEKYRHLEKLENEAIAKTKRMHKSSKKADGRDRAIPTINKEKVVEVDDLTPKTKRVIVPFEDIDYGAFE
jgi:putative transposase